MRETFRSVLIVATVAALVASCRADPGTADSTTGVGRPPAAALPAVLDHIVSGRAAPATDTFEVWVCSVPSDTTDPLYDASGERITLTADDVVRRIGQPVAAFFAGISHDAYRPDFRAGGMVAIDANDSSQQCIDHALARSSRAAGADAVLVVADAQHAHDQPGGRSTPGSWLTCGDDCNAATTGRFVYVGANDFHPGLSGAMPLDLIEHELGHSLGLPHSGDVVGAEGNRGVGRYDLMADSASPRTIDGLRRDAPDTLAINRLDLRWMPIDAVHVVDVARASATLEQVELAPSTGPGGTRAAVVAIDDHRMLTVELLAATGFDDHLPRTGVVVHLVDDSPEQCGATTRCEDLERVQQIVAADAASAVDRTLLAAGDTATFGQWRVTVDAINPAGGPTGDRALVTIARADDS